MNLRRSACALVGMLSLAMFIPGANATIELKLDDGLGHTVDLLDGAAGDSCAEVNCVTFNGPVGDWNINVDTGTSKDASAPSLVDLAYQGHHKASTTASTLTISISDNGFTPAVKEVEFNVGGTLTSGTFTATAFGGTDNTKFSTVHQIGTFSTTTNPYSHTSFGAGLNADPFQLTLVATQTFGKAAGTFSGDMSLDPVPEPASVALLGGILLLTTGAIRRKVRRG